MSEINQLLLFEQDRWAKEVGIDAMANEYGISNPFCFAVTEEYLSEEKRIMIIGQEPYDYGSFSYREELLNNQQKVTVDILRAQLGYCSGKYIGSPFWNMFRKFKAKGIEPVWNNVDKCHRIIDGKTVPLTVEIERIMSASYGEDKKSLLKREIEISKPKAILFVTGSYYHETMSIALGISDSSLNDSVLCKDSPYRDISGVSELNIPVFWAYHPKYLQMIGAVDSTIDKIVEMI